MWRQVWSSNNALVDHLEAHLGLHTRVVQAMKCVDRNQFCRNKDEAYADAPLSIGHEQTISAPHMHGMTLNLLEPKLVPGRHFLDVGSGSGIMCAYAAQMMKLKSDNTSRICGVEVLKPVYEMSVENLRQYDSEMFDRMHLIQGDGWKGLSEFAPYDAIHVGAAAAGVPVRLLSQMSIDGLLVLPFEIPGRDQYLLLIKRLTKNPVDVDHDVDDEEAAKQLANNVREEGSEFVLNLPVIGRFCVQVITRVAFVPLVKKFSG